MQRWEASPEERATACSDLLGSAVSVIAVAVELQELVRNLPQVVEQPPGRTAGSLGGRVVGQSESDGGTSRARPALANTPPAVPGWRARRGSFPSKMAPLRVLGRFV